MNADRPDRTDSDPQRRAGFVVLTGLPNVGKSTLLNALVGEHLSIATAKAQTTWQRVAGIRTEGSVQMVLVDTPGILGSRQLFHRSMTMEAERAMEEADVAIGVVDGGARARGGAIERVGDLLRGAGCPAAIAANKADLRRFDPAGAQRLAEDLGVPLFTISARTGAGLRPLVSFIGSRLPKGPFLYPEDDIAAAPTRFFVRELIRETVFELYHQEIPYSVAVQIDEFREEEDPLYIAASLHVERKSQKGLVIGKRGVAIKALGRAARIRIEHFLGRRVYLDLWVKVTEGWRRRRKGLAMFGYRVPDESA